ncbi:hypothetical protein ES703_28659 [subsurface metagenome]
MKIKILILGLLICVIALIAIGCVSTLQVAPVPWQEVKVFYDEADVPGEFETIATFRYEGEAIEAIAEKQIEKMKKRAGKLGANGIILKGMPDPDADEVVYESKIQATAIRLK